jgi:hypothetical protein
MKFHRGAVQGFEFQCRPFYAHGRGIAPGVSSLLTSARNILELQTTRIVLSDDHRAGRS